MTKQIRNSIRISYRRIRYRTDYYMINGSKFRDIFYNTRQLNEREYEHSRKMSIFEGCTARAAYNLTSGAFLAGYANFLGADDSFNGIIGAIPVLAGVMSIISPMYFEKTDRRKLIVTILNFLHRLILGLMVVIPLIAAGRTSRLALLAAFYMAAYMSIALGNPAGSSILIDLTPERMRGRYFSKREASLLAVGTVFTLIFGRILDAYKEAGNQYGGFVVIFSAIIVLAFANGFFWSRIKEPVSNREMTSYNLKQIISIPMKDHAFRKIIIFFVLYNIGLQVGGPFFSIYMVTGLKLDYTYIMIMGMISTATNVLLVRVWGRIADKKSWNFVLTNSIMTLGICHFFWSFVSGPNAFFLVPILHMLGGAAWAGIGISTFNIQFIYSPENGRTVYTGFNAALGGFMGFLGTTAGSLLLKAFEGLSFAPAGISIGGMQMLFGISGILLFLCSIYSRIFIKPVAR